jgi:isocitrate dehydrogenase
LPTIDRANSGAEIVKNDIETISKDIENLLNKYYSRFIREERAFYEREFKKSRYNYYNEYAKSGSYTENKIFNELNEIKHHMVKPLIKSISDYIMLKLNKDNGYKADVLESLNFRPCKGSLCGGGNYIHIATL